MRHIGLLRAYVPLVLKDPDTTKTPLGTYRNGSGSGEGLFSSGSAVDGRRSGRRVGSGREWYAGKSSAAILRDRALVRRWRFGAVEKPSNGTKKNNGAATLQEYYLVDYSY